MDLAERFAIDDLVVDGLGGDLWSARDTTTGGRAHVAVLDGSAPTALRKHFVPQAQKLISLGHDNVAGVFICALDAEDNPCVVLDRPEGALLHEWLRDNPEVTDENLVRLAQGVTRAVAALHAVEVVHGDLEPGNVLVTREGDALVPKLVGHGLNRAYVRSGALAAADGDADALRSLSYASPGQVGGGDPTKAHDLYSLGAILHLLVEGRPPCEGTSLGALRKAIGAGTTPTVRGSGAGVRGALAPVVERALAKSPAARFATADELLRAVEGATDPDAAAAEKASSDKAAADKATRDKAAADKATRDKAAADKAARDRAVADRAARDKAASEKAARDKAAADKAARDRAARDKAAADKAARDKAAAEKAARDRAARDKAAADKAARDKAASEKAARDKAAADKAARDRAARDKAAASSDEADPEKSAIRPRWVPPSPSKYDPPAQTKSAPRRRTRRQGTEPGIGPPPAIDAPLVEGADSLREAEAAETAEIPGSPSAAKPVVGVDKPQTPQLAPGGKWRPAPADTFAERAVAEPAVESAASQPVRRAPAAPPPPPSAVVRPDPAAAAPESEPESPHAVPPPGGEEEIEDDIKVILSPSFAPPPLEVADEPGPEAVPATQGDAPAVRPVGEPTERIALDSRSTPRRRFGVPLLVLAVGIVAAVVTYALVEREAPSPQLGEDGTPNRTANVAQQPVTDEGQGTAEEVGQDPALELGLDPDLEPEPEPEPEPERFRVVLSGLPEAAEVTVDGEAVVIEPEFTLARGEHLIVVSAPGYEPWERRVETEDHTNVTVDLTPIRRRGRSTGSMRSGGERRRGSKGGRMRSWSPMLLSNPGI